MTKKILLTILLFIFFIQLNWSQEKMEQFIVCVDKQIENPASKFCNRSEIIGNNGIDDALFLAQLWTFYGKPPAVSFEGFVYQLMDNETGTVFQAYSGASGPAYCFSQKDFDKAKQIIVKFEKLLATKSPSDCEVIIKTDFGKYRIGYKEGKRIQERIED